jgi:hypothetical protein
MAWPKGRPRPEGVGRKAGTPNKFTQLKQDLLDCVYELGGKKWIMDTAKTDPMALLKIIAGLLPRDDKLKLGIDADLAALLMEARNQRNS